MVAMSAVKRFAAACLLIGASCGAQADYASFLALSGTATYFPGYCYPPLPCSTTGPWQGTVKVVTDSGVDGTYLGGGGVVSSPGAQLLSFALDSNAAAFVASGPYYAGSFSVDLAGGQVTSISGSYSYQVEKYNFSGLAVTYDSGFHYHATDVKASGILVPIPETASYAMLLAGLGLLGFIVRRKKQ